MKYILKPFFCLLTITALTVSGLLAQKNKKNAKTKSNTKSATTKPKVDVITDADSDLLPVNPKPKAGDKKPNSGVKVPVLTDADGDLLPVNPKPKAGDKKPNSGANVPVLTDADGDLLPVTPKPKAGDTKPKSGANVPILTDADGDLLPVKPKSGDTKPKSGANVPVLTDADGDLLPVNPKPKSGDTKPKSGANVPVLTDADSDLLDIKSNEPNPNDLLDIKFPTGPKQIPNAGTNITYKKLEDNFTFNQKFIYTITQNEKVIFGEFYLNTKNGYSYLPHNAMAEMAAEKMEGEIHQILSPVSDLYQYAKSTEGNFSMQLQNSNSLAFLRDQGNHDANRFFKTFKKTGKKVTFGTYKSIEYKGKDDEGKTVFVYLANPRGIKIDIKQVYAITGFWGLGYIASPTGNTYLITCIQAQGNAIMLNGIDNVSESFNGAAYTPMGERITEGLEERKNQNLETSTAELQEINAIENTKLKAATLHQFKETKKLKEMQTAELQKAAKSNDINTINNTNGLTNAVLVKQLYIVEKAKLNVGLVELQIQLANLNDINSDYSKQEVQSTKCKISCNEKQIADVDKTSKAHLQIIEKYKKNTNLLHTKVNEIIVQNAKPPACNCK